MIIAARGRKKPCQANTDSSASCILRVRKLTRKAISNVWLSQSQKYPGIQAFSLN